MYLKSLFFCFAFLLSSCTSYSTIKGVVRDKATSSPISSATVTIPKSDVSTTTNALGYYTLVGLFSSGDMVMANAPGYNIYTGTVKNGVTEILDIELAPKN